MVPRRFRCMLRCRTCKARLLRAQGYGFSFRRPGSRPRRSKRCWSTSLRGVAVRPDRAASAKVETATRSVATSRLAGEHAPRPPTTKLVVAFPPPNARGSSSTRSGPSWPRRRRIAIPLIRRMTTREIPGTMWRSIPESRLVVSVMARRTFRPRTSRAVVQGLAATHGGAE